MKTVRVKCSFLFIHVWYVRVESRQNREFDLELYVNSS